MGWVDLTEGPDGLRSRATGLSGHAEGFAGRLQGLLQQIAAVEAGRPWGGDKYGDAFVKSYSQATEAGPFNEAVDAMTRDLGPEATEIGTALSAGASDYQIEDLRTADEISRLV